MLSAFANIYMFSFFVCPDQDVYRNISSTIVGVIQGLNATVFAYGSTGRYMFDIAFLFFCVLSYVTSSLHSRCCHDFVLGPLEDFKQ